MLPSFFDTIIFGAFGTLNCIIQRYNLLALPGCFIIQSETDLGVESEELDNNAQYSTLRIKVENVHDIDNLGLNRLTIYSFIFFTLYVAHNSTEK